MKAEFLFFIAFSLNIIKPLHSTSSVTDLQGLKQMISYPEMCSCDWCSNATISESLITELTATHKLQIKNSVPGDSWHSITLRFLTPSSTPTDCKLNTEGWKRSGMGQWMNAWLRWEFRMHFLLGQNKYKDTRYEALCSPTRAYHVSDNRAASVIIFYP
jgi:hypothetical protein